MQTQNDDWVRQTKTFWCRKTKLTMSYFVFWFQMKKQIQKTFFIFQNLKTIIKIFEFIFWFEITKWISKKIFLFPILVIKLEIENWKILNLKICFVFKSKNELYFRYTDYIWMKLIFIIFKLCKTMQLLFFKKLFFWIMLFIHGFKLFFNVQNN